MAVVLARLSPVDYHHVHYFDHGRTLGHDRLGRRLWTGNWHALLNKPEILVENERQVKTLSRRSMLDGLGCPDRPLVGGPHRAGASAQQALSARRRKIGVSF